VTTPQQRSEAGSEGGSAALALPVATVLVVVTSLALGDLGSLMVARARAQTAADAAALAAAVEIALGGPPGPDAPAEQARRLAAANGARLVFCRCPSGPRPGEPEGPDGRVGRDDRGGSGDRAPARARSRTRTVVVEVDVSLRPRLLPRPVRIPAEARADARLPWLDKDTRRLHAP
jgi:secretion/DNA translocation related TadE-like protein